ncbi:sigma-70 family RNA polymerase sigma factor [Sorangium sp. So ce367]|uniref:RNA polymerase sigma factor n=1 Tax=Sorangium sp. So ce367 TaxID=3133305 RepID=UPI003F5E0203
MSPLANALEGPPRASPAPGGLVPSFEQLFVDHAPFVWRALRRLGVHDADAEDVCQEVFMIVHRRLASFEGRSSVQTWMYGICVRVAADYRKRAHRRRESTRADLPEQVAPEDQHGALEDREARALLDACVQTLDDDKRAVFVLFELEELPMTEVAEAVGCPLQTAYARLYAARRVVEAALRRATAGRRVP